MRPVVVFTDGFGPHRHRIGKDMAQRMALVQSGKYRVWSLTWGDVESRLRPLGSYYHDYLSHGSEQGFDASYVLH